MPRTDDFMIEQNIFLGGQIAEKHKIFKDLARMTPDYGEIYYLLKWFEEWEKEPDEMKIALEILELFGEAEFVRQLGELSKLSMVLGDYRKRYNVGGVLERLRKSRQDTST